VAEPRRVLQLLGPSTGGIRRHVAALAAGLADQGWTAPVAGPAGVMDGIGPQDAVVPVPAGLDPRQVRRCRRALRSVLAGGGGAGRLDIVHAHGLKAGLLASTVKGARPLVVTVHNLVLDEAAGRSARLLRRLESRLPRRADRVIAVSGQIAERFAGLPGADRVVVVPPVVEEAKVRRPRDQVRAALGVDRDAPLVVCVARLHPQKDLATFVRAMQRVRAALPAARAVVVGTGPEEAAVRRLVAELGLDDTVLLMGQSPNAPDEMAAADVVVVSSLWESGPLVVVEAMELGRLVVSTPVGFVPQLVDDGVGGRIVPVGDPEAMGDAIVGVLQDPDAARALGRAGQEVVRTRFDRHRLVADVAAVYDDLLATPAPADDDEAGGRAATPETSGGAT
jgi:glycosyltransferase involved in cell wall biosynthesis